MTGNERAYHEFLTSDRRLDRPFHFFPAALTGLTFDPENVRPFLRGTVQGIAGSQQEIGVDMNRSRAVTASVV